MLWIYSWIWLLFGQAVTAIWLAWQQFGRHATITIYKECLPTYNNWLASGMHNLILVRVNHPTADAP